MSEPNNIRHVNYDSDFRVVFAFPDNKLPSYPWRLELKTANTPAYNTYAASFDGSVYTHCLPLEDGSILVLVNGHRLSPGMLCYNMKRDVPDDLFPDGEMNITTPGCTGIELWNGPSEELPVEQIEVIIATLRGDSAYELYIKHHPESNLTEEEYASLPIKAIAEANIAREKIEKTESEIRSAEQQRAQAETLRAEAETARADAERSRTVSESERAAHEASRTASEETRIQSESDRLANERQRAAAEQGRTAAEAARSEQEQTRIANEQARGTAFREAIDETHAAAQAATAAAGDLETPLEVLAHAGCTLDERLAAVERLLLDVLSGKTLVPELQVKKLGVWGGNNLVLTGDGAPVKAPDRAGQFYIDTTARALYYSTGNAAVSDWINA